MRRYESDLNEENKKHSVLQKCIWYATTYIFALLTYESIWRDTSTAVICFCKKRFNASVNLN